MNPPESSALLYPKKLDEILQVEEGSKYIAPPSITALFFINEQ